jgi:Spy/CpxP family protein refolding chaperone
MKKNTLMSVFTIVIAMAMVLGACAPAATATTAPAAPAAPAYWPAGWHFDADQDLDPLDFGWQQHGQVIRSPWLQD